jgi:predicted Zn-dependent protease
MLGHEMGHVVLGHQTQVWQAIIQRTGIQPKSWTELGARAGGIEPMEREQEYEADKFGYDLANKAGFNAEEGARELFSNLHGDALHPPPYSRLAALGIMN